MDAPPGTDNPQPTPHNQNRTESIQQPPSSDADMTKRSDSNHYLSERTNHKKDSIASYLRLPKVPLLFLRRSWRLKFVFFLCMCASTVFCVYSGVISLVVPSFSFNLKQGKNDGIRIPRIAIEIEPGGLKTEDSPAQNGEVSTIESPKQTTVERKGERRLPSSIIFGVSKCGTKAILEYLKLHPDVVAPVTEINFFNNETLLKRGTKWYLQQMPLARSYQMIVEKSPDYFQNPQCAPMIRKMNESIKLLLLLRDPVERLVSQYMQLLAKNPNLPQFEKWVLHPVTEKVNTNIQSVMVSAYVNFIEYWLAVFPWNQILIIESDSLRYNPYIEMKRVERFLGLKAYYDRSDFYFNSTRGFYCLRYRSTGKTKCLGKSKGRQHITVDDDVLKLLYSFYEPHNQRLNELLGAKFPWS